MKISTEISSIAKHVGEEQAIQLVAKAGFDAYDFSMFAMAPYSWTEKKVTYTGHPLQTTDHLQFARKLKAVAEDNGIVCNQSHAPFPVFYDSSMDYMKRAIECTAEAGGQICVIHPEHPKSAEENAKMYLELLPFAKDHGVKIATENMWAWKGTLDHAVPAACSTPESFNAYLNAVNDPYFVACLDIGHAEMRGLGTSAPEMILALDTHLQALHIHDNDCWHDSHALPFTKKIDFVAVMAALKKIGYTGYLTLEADQHCADCAAEELPGKVQEMAVAARKLSDMMEM